jgi:hypothetical protein
VNIELLNQLRQCLVSLDRSKGYLGLESRCVIPSRPFHAPWHSRRGLSKAITYRTVRNYGTTSLGTDKHNFVWEMKSVKPINTDT